MQKECIDYDIIEQERYLVAFDLQFFADDDSDKTEEPTSKKLSDARNEGKVVKSKELSSAFGLIVLFLCLRIFVGYVGQKLLGVFSFIYDNMADFVSINEKGVTTKAVSSLLYQVVTQWLLIVLPFFIFGFVVSILVNVVQVGWKVTTKPMQPKLSKFNPINGFKRIFSKESLFQLVLSIIKVAVIFLIAFSYLRSEAGALYLLYDMGLNQAIAYVGNLIIDVGLRIGIVYLFVGVADYYYQKYKFRKDMRMTKQEVKDEFKNSEGDPQVKGQIRKKMMEVSQRRMMQDVPKADVVITNPTHFAVALKYDTQEHAAPHVVAKGEDYLAQKIKEVAREHGVAIVENKPLARMLYHNVEIGAEIPPELYQAVAEVLVSVIKAKENA